MILFLRNGSNTNQNVIRIFILSDFSTRFCLVREIRRKILRWISEQFHHLWYVYIALFFKVAICVMFLLLIFYCILGMSYSVYRDIVTNETYGGLWQVIVTRLPNALFGLSVTGLCSKSSQPFHTGQFWTKNNFSFTYSTKTTELIVYTIT